MTLGEILYSRKECGDYTYDHGTLYYKGETLGQFRSSATNQEQVYFAWRPGKAPFTGYQYVTFIELGEDFHQNVLLLIEHAKLIEVGKALDGTE